MVSIAELRSIRETEAKLLLTENKKRMELKKVEDEKEKLIRDIKRIKLARNRERIERKKKASKQLEKIKKSGKKIGKKVMNYLYNLRGY